MAGLVIPERVDVACDVVVAGELPDDARAEQHRLAA